MKSGKTSVVGKDTAKKNISTKDLKGFKKRVETLEREIQELALTIDNVEDEKLEITNQLKKTLADYRNLENGIDKRVETRLNHIKKSVGQSLMTLMDDIHYGLKAKEGIKMSTEADSWANGISETVSKMSGTLKELGIEIMEVQIGDDLDSALHEVVTVVSGEENNKIVDLLQPGYVMGEMVVRPAKVIVSKQSE